MSPQPDALRGKVRKFRAPRVQRFDNNKSGRRGPRSKRTFTPLGDLPGGGFFSRAVGVSGDGSTVVGQGSSSSGPEAFRWTASGGGMAGLGDLPGGGFFSVAYGVSGDGSTVVGFSDSGFHGAFIWDEVNGMRNIADLLTLGGADLSGWRLSEARGISADGRDIVGYGSNPSGAAEAWLVDLAATAATDAVPEPLTLVTWLGLAVCGAVVAGTRCWLRRPTCPDGRRYGD